jgi:hypothetical protein
MLPPMSEHQNPLNAVDEIYTNPEPLVEFVKMQIGFWEKLVVLDAATLAASFSASSMLHEHFSGDGGVGYLAAAWKLLLWGITLCLLAQWVAFTGAMAISGHYYGMRVLSLLNKSAAEVSALGGRVGPEYLSISSEIAAKSPKLRSGANVFSRFAGALGSAGLLASITAFYWLYRFAHASINSPGH